jgi:membrane protease YdiL (CAAX protease family)
MKTSPEEPELAGSLTPVCIVVYLALHAIWRQIVLGPESFVYLRVFFLLSIAAFLFGRGRSREIMPYFFGRFLPTFRLVPALLLMAAIIFLRIVAEMCHSYPLMHGSSALVDNCLIAPANEEIVFRGIFLAILLQQMPRHPYAAIWIGTLIFISIHDLHFARLQSLLLMGWMLGWIFHRGRSVCFCILCHILWNLVAFVPLPFLPR